MRSSSMDVLSHIKLREKLERANSTRLQSKAEQVRADGARRAEKFMGFNADFNKRKALGDSESEAVELLALAVRCEERAAILATGVFPRRPVDEQDYRGDANARALYTMALAAGGPGSSGLVVYETPVSAAVV
jgi:hypothetical protein